MYLDQTWDIKWSDHKDHFVQQIMIIIQWTGKLVIGPDNLLHMWLVVAIGIAGGSFV